MILLRTWLLKWFMSPRCHDLLNTDAVLFPAGVSDSPSELICSCWCCRCVFSRGSPGYQTAWSSTARTRCPDRRSSPTPTAARRSTRQNVRRSECIRASDDWTVHATNVQAWSQICPVFKQDLSVCPDDSRFHFFSLVSTQIGGTVVSYMDGCCKTCEYLTRA